MEMNITPLSLAHYYKTYVWLVEEGDVTCRAEIGAHVLRERERERWFVLWKKELDICITSQATRVSYVAKYA
jgi:hypothetical protein